MRADSVSIHSAQEEDSSPMIGGCCVCSEENGSPENPLVYCDGKGCSVAVHKACYGIVEVPPGEDPWYCRKCEEGVCKAKCELCPSKDGAMKRTDTGGWAHVLCGLYIPEVQFGNLTTMEPLQIGSIPTEKFEKVCSLCKERGKEKKATVGACMQCAKPGCKVSFHVTCAQVAGLLCEQAAGNSSDHVQYCGYCAVHLSKLRRGSKTIKAFKPLASLHSPESSPDKISDPSTSSGFGKTKRRKASTSGTPRGPSPSGVGSPTPPPDLIEPKEESGDGSSKFTTANFTEMSVVAGDSIFGGGGRSSGSEMEPTSSDVPSFSTAPPAERDGSGETMEVVKAEEPSANLPLSSSAPAAPPLPSTSSSAAQYTDFFGASVMEAAASTNSRKKSGKERARGRKAHRQGRKPKTGYGRHTGENTSVRSEEHSQVPDEGYKPFSLLGNELNPSSTVAKQMFDTFYPNVDATGTPALSEERTPDPVDVKRLRNLFAPSPLPVRHENDGERKPPVTLEDLVDCPLDDSLSFLIGHNQSLNLPRLLNEVCELREDNQRRRHRIEDMQKKLHQLRSLKQELMLTTTRSIAHHHHMNPHHQPTDGSPSNMHRMPAAGTPTSHHKTQSPVAPASHHPNPIHPVSHPHPSPSYHVRTHPVYPPSGPAPQGHLSAAAPPQGPAPPQQLPPGHHPPADLSRKGLPPTPHPHAYRAHLPTSQPQHWPTSEGTKMNKTH